MIQIFRKLSRNLRNTPSIPFRDMILTNANNVCGCTLTWTVGHETILDWIPSLLGSPCRWWDGMRSGSGWRRRSGGGSGRNKYIYPRRRRSRHSDGNPFDRLSWFSNICLIRMRNSEDVSPWQISFGTALLICVPVSTCQSSGTHSIPY